MNHNFKISFIEKGIKKTAFTEESKVVIELCNKPEITCLEINIDGHNSCLEDVYCLD